MTPEQRAHWHRECSAKFSLRISADALEALLRADEELEALRAEIEAAQTEFAQNFEGEAMTQEELLGQLDHDELLDLVRKREAELANLREEAEELARLRGMLLAEREILRERIADAPVEEVGDNHTVNLWLTKAADGGRFEPGERVRILRVKP